jgi:hypothetical protein
MMLNNKVSAVLVSGLVAGLLTIGQSAAAPQATPAPSEVMRRAPLPAGPATSVREAQGIGRPLLYWAGAGAVIIAGVILIAGPQDDDDTSTTTTTGTGN